MSQASASPATASGAFAFERVAVVNRGEPAMRLINAVREWNAEGRPALRVIAVYTAADRHATFVRQADEAVLIGPEDPGAAFEGSPYLDYAELERALRACRADAVWPGWGFVSEKAEFADLCARLGINAVREWNAEGRPALRVIAVYTAADRHATFVREADESVLIGPAEADAAFEGSPYLDYAELERALRACRADAVWPGWGFVSEKAEFAELCDRLGIIFIGPSAEVMRRLGDKIESKLLAERAEVPLAPWSGGPVPDLAAAREAAESIGYPLMVKATAGGGGRGIRMVRAPEDLEEAFERASSEASKTAGDATVFLERAIRGGRHVEVQVVADAEGAGSTIDDIRAAFGE